MSDQPSSQPSSSKLFTQLAIAQLGNPVLRQTAQPITDPNDPQVQALIDSLIDVLYQTQGVGIAAPQVAVSQQIIIVASHPNARYPNAPEMEPTPMINPRLVSHGEEVVKDWEGCLSVPGIRGQVPRYESIEVTYCDRHGRPQHRELTSFIARIFQHECDHLTGHVFLDRLETVRDIITDQEYLKRLTPDHPI
ncbi:MAG: peptide deformylase [Synechococcales bacterium]|nr:peptide deformylase [Synechococcales bacterium]